MKVNLCECGGSDCRNKRNWCGGGDDVKIKNVVGLIV